VPPLRKYGSFPIYHGRTNSIKYFIRNDRRDKGVFGKTMCSFRTLIVEDNPLFRQTILDFLRSQFPSMTLEDAGDGKTALEKIGKALPDLVFMDIKLPGENGLHLTEHIKKKHPGVVVAVLTSYDWPEYREAAFKFGANYFIIKGSSTNKEIVGLIESILKERGFGPNGACGKDQDEKG
jgi:DNA-binding NarL/FixJ family response regulator